MDAASISALAALRGALIGGLTSFAASWVTQHTQARAQQLAHKLTRREELYKEFIDEASKLYADSLIHETSDVTQLVKLYSMIGRMRILSSTKTLESADQVARAGDDASLERRQSRGQFGNARLPGVSIIELF
jgi:hypothetical protein